MSEMSSDFQGETANANIRLTKSFLLSSNIRISLYVSSIHRPKKHNFNTFIKRIIYTARSSKLLYKPFQLI